jgi:hypothetical protein
MLAGIKHFNVRLIILVLNEIQFSNIHIIEMPD